MFHTGQLLMSSTGNLDAHPLPRPPANTPILLEIKGEMPLTWLLSMWASQIRAQNPESIRQLRIKPLLEAAREEWKEPFLRRTPSQMQWLRELQSGNSTPGEQLAANGELPVYFNFHSGPPNSAVGAGPPAAPFPGTPFEPGPAPCGRCRNLHVERAP